MEIAANEVLNSFYRRYRYSVYVPFFSVLVVYVIFIPLFFHEHGALAAMVGLVLGLFFLIKQVRMIILGTNYFGGVVNYIKLDGNQITLETISISFFGGLIKALPLSVELNKQDVLFKKSESDYKNYKEYLDDVYLIVDKEKEYLLCRRFFDDFDSILRVME